MDVDSESRQRILTATSANLAATNYMLDAVKAKLATRGTSGSKDKLSNPSLLTTMKICFHCSKFMRS